MGSLGGLISGLIGSGQSLPTVNVQALLDTIKKAGGDQRALINSLPQNIQDQLAAYTASTNGAADTLKANVTNQGNDYLGKVGQIYGPNSEAANLEKDATRQDIYSTVPGTQTAIRNALAATGGLSRGHAGESLAQPYVQAAGDYSKAAAGINAKQSAAGQDATAKALATVNSMNDQMFQQLFGMSKEQAQTILTTSNQALRDQLAQLITQSTNETNQTLGVEGVSANNAYQNAVTRNAQQNAIWSNAADLGIQGVTAGLTGGMGGGMAALPAGADVGSADYMRNASQMASSMGY